MKKNFINYLILIFLCITQISAQSVSVHIPIIKMAKAAYNARPYLTELDKEVKITTVGKKEFIFVVLILVKLLKI